MKKSTIDIFVPCYNASQFLEECMESLLNQTYSDFRIILLDDGSTDGSLDIAEKFAKSDNRLLIYRNDINMGVSYTRNRGLSLCEADYIAFMDADDVAPLNRIEREKEFLDSNPNIDGVGGYYQIIDEKGEKGTLVELEPRESEKLKKTMVFKNIIANGSAMIRRRMILDNDLRYPENFAGVEDYYFWITFLKTGEFQNIPEVMQYYRMVSTGLSKSNSSDEAKLLRRNECFDEIHRMAFSQVGIILSEEDEDILCRCFRDRSYLTSEKDKKRCKHLCDEFRNQGYVI